MAFVRISVAVTAMVVILATGVVLASAVAQASLPEPIDQTSVAPVKIVWFDGSNQNVQEQGSDPDAGINGLAKKFSKYDVLFKNVFDNAHSALDGFQMKYKFTF